ncbi:MAG TPA: type I DNA topoisomerase [bacterium]|nr:type I DNA topoisomerase [bacterium]
MTDKVLVIVESKAKANTIAKYLNAKSGKRYTVRACLGHVRDLPKSTLGINIEDNFKLRYSVSPDRKEIVEDLQHAARDSDEILLATDPDREGEAIAWHLQHILLKGPAPKKPAAKKGKKADDEGEKAKAKANPKAKKLSADDVRRIEFNEITKRAIEEALKHPRPINQDRVDAQQARRVLDRIVGYTLSPYLWREIKEGLSAGRVQSVALRLICDREAEIEAFVPVEYWTIEGDFAKPHNHGEHFKAELVAIKGQKIGMESGDFQLPDQRITHEVLGRIRSGSYHVADVKVTEVVRKPPPPYKTSTLQQEASKRLGMSPREVMRIAQQLYEGLDVGEGSVGLITYMRTDSTRLANDALDMVRGFIPEEYGPDYLPPKPNYYTPPSKNVQDAHEAIRPTEVRYTPERVARYLDPKQLKVYRLIWERFVACQMVPGVDTRRTVTVKGGQGNEFTFRANHTQVKFDGFRRVAGLPKREEAPLPEVTPPEPLDLLTADGEQHFTQPPPRYTNASLVKTLEEKGIGRPSTYAPTLSTIRSREYVTVDKGTFYPTPLGRQVDALLKAKFPDVIDVDFTRRMEEDLDKIETKGMDWIDVVREFYGPFQDDLIKALGEDCPKCASPLLLKNGPFGTYMACSSTACDFTRNLAEEDLDEQCPECQSPLRTKMGRFGKFVACTNYPECKYTRNMGRGGTTQPQEKVYSETPCPGCGGRLVLRTSKAGRFWGCEKYPECKGLLPYTIEVNCPKCGKPLSERRVSKGRSAGKPFWGCTGYPNCDFVSWTFPKAGPDGVALPEEKPERKGKKVVAEAD